MKHVFGSLVLVYGLATGFTGAQSITVVPPTVYDPDTVAMDAALGITGFVIEGFEDASLIPGLTIEYTNPGAGPLSTLPGIASAASCTASGVVTWDGQGVLVNTFNNIPWVCVGSTDDISNLITFHMNPPVETFGVGLAQFNDGVNHALFVNGNLVESALGDLPGFVPSASRNGYLRLDAVPGQPISSVTFEMPQVSPFSPDGVFFDHLALATPAASGPGRVAEFLVTGFDPITDEVSLSYTPGCGSADHGIVYGLLEDVATYGYLGSECSIGSSGNHVLALPGPGSYFFLVVANDGVDAEGSYGTDSLLQERPADPFCFANQAVDASCD